VVVATLRSEWQAALKLDASSRVFAVITEGATDPERYAELVGLTPAEVAGQAA